MNSTDIGDLTLTPDGDGLRLTIATQQPTTTLSAAGVMVLWEVLYAWLWEQADAPVPVHEENA